MPLPVGTRLGPYEVLTLIGAGGMGEVYKATDTRLSRTVAIKVLSAHFSQDPDVKQRFEREAQTIAGLNHPHICTLHDVGSQDGVDFLVMECVTGETLAARLERGPLPVAEAVRVASEIGDALDSAHRQGIVHRDLKPGNIMLTKSGAKLLDFGLAKLRAVDSPAPMTVTVSAMPTNAKELTMAGAILGTLQYMAPEQLEGKDADARTDVFAFGATLHEMLTGKKAFQGKTQVSLMAAILEHDPPPMSSLQPILPAALDSLVQGCLAKDPEDRWQSIRDVVRQLKQIGERPVDAAANVTTPSRIGRRERVAWGVVAGVLAVALAALGIRAALRTEPVPQLVRFTVTPPPDTRFGATAPRLSVSPDGRLLVFSAVGTGPDLTEQFWIRRLDSTDTRPVARTEASPGELAPQSPFWSPDSRVLGFVVQSEGGDAGVSKVKTVDIESGLMRTLCELPSNNAAASWSADDVILVSSQRSLGIQRIAASGGVPTPVTTLDESREEVAHLFPQFLPDSRHFIYQSQTRSPEGWAIYAGSLDSADRTMIVDAAYARFAAPDLLLFVQENVLLAQRMDLDRLTLIGEPVLVAEALPVNLGNGRAAFDVSNTGVLVTAAGDAESAAGRHLIWTDRNGTQSAPIGPLLSAFTIRLSPDGGRVAFAESQAGGRQDLWTVDLNRGVKVPLTTDPAPDGNPVWAHDGSRVFFGSPRGGRGLNAIYQKPADGSTTEQVLVEAGDLNQLPLDASRDGRFLVFAKVRSGVGDLWWMPISGNGEPMVYRATPFDERQASFSPDARWLAYVSNESGRYEVIVQPFPDASGGKWPISTNGGVAPRWKRDGSEIYYVDPTNQLVAVSVSTGDGFRVGDSEPLLRLPTLNANPAGSAFVYDAAADGQRFLVVMPTSALADVQPPLTVTINWTAAIK